MSKKYNTLVIEDHLIIQSAYNEAFSKYSKEFNVTFNIQTATNCDDAIEIINNSSNIDLVFLDIRIPNSEKFYSGEDIGVFIRKKSPKTKIIIATSIDTNYRIHSIMQSISPEGFIIKNDFDSKGVIDVIQAVLSDCDYYSKTVLRYLRQQMSSDFLLGKVDRKILYELSIGTTTKALPYLIDLSLGGIEKRKRNLREIFNVPNNSKLILKAKKLGFI